MRVLLLVGWLPLLVLVMLLLVLLLVLLVVVLRVLRLVQLLLVLLLAMLCYLKEFGLCQGSLEVSEASWSRLGALLGLRGAAWEPSWEPSSGIFGYLRL